MQATARSEREQTAMRALSQQVQGPPVHEDSPGVFVRDSGDAVIHTPLRDAFGGSTGGTPDAAAGMLPSPSAVPLVLRVPSDTPVGPAESTERLAFLRGFFHRLRTVTGVKAKYFEVVNVEEPESMPALPCKYLLC